MLDRSLSDLVAALRVGDVTVESLAEAALERQAHFAEMLGPYKTSDPALTRRHAAAAAAAFDGGADLGPLQGIPVSVKDLFGVVGFPSFAGTPHRLPSDWEREGPVVGALRRQLGVVMGKTHTVELAFGGIGTNPHWGTPRNPWDADAHRVPGGSSAGAGVSLMEGSAIVALGTDTAGSVRIPASMTGVVGLKTTHGRWSLDGIFPLSHSLDTPGLLARTVADIAVAFAALDQEADIAHPLPDVAGLRLGVPESFFWADCSPGVEEGVREALTALERKGAKLIPFALDGTEEAYDFLRQGGLAAAECYEFLSAELPDVLDSLDPNVRNRMVEAADLPAPTYIHRKRRLGMLARAAVEAMDRAGIDMVVTPTVANTPPTLAEVETPEGYSRNNLLALRNTSIGNLLALCALTMPVALDAAGMPVGLQLFARPFGESRLLAMAGAIEAALGTARNRLGPPPLCR